jgi:predicted TIM-barrel fold metal-dependent hydrolase
MLIVDAQVHIWSSGKPTNANHRQVPAFTKDELLKEMDEAGVDAAVIHPPASWDPNSNELAVEAARQHPNRLAILGNFPLDRPESRALIDGWKRRPGMLGLRFTFLQPHQKTWPTDGTIDWLWPAAERAGLPVALLAAGFLPKLAQVAQQHPGLKLIIDHLRRIYDAFGPERMFWGTDITRMPCTWRHCVTMFTEELPWLAGRDKELVMGRAVCDWLGWRLAAK